MASRKRKPDAPSEEARPLETADDLCNVVDRVHDVAKRGLKALENLETLAFQEDESGLGRFVLSYQPRERWNVPELLDCVREMQRAGSELERYLAPSSWVGRCMALATGGAGYVFRSQHGASPFAAIQKRLADAGTWAAVMLDAGAWKQVGKEPPGDREVWQELQKVCTDPDRKDPLSHAVALHECVRNAKAWLRSLDTSPRARATKLRILEDVKAHGPTTWGQIAKRLGLTDKHVNKVGAPFLKEPEPLIAKTGGGPATRLSITSAGERHVDMLRSVGESH